MAIKTGAKDCSDTARRRKGVFSPLVEDRKPIFERESLPRTQRVTRSQARCQSEVPAIQTTSKHKSTRALLNGKAVSRLYSNETAQTPRKKQSSKSSNEEKPAPEQSQPRPQPQPLPLTKETLSLLDHSTRSYRSPSMVSDNTEKSEATKVSINAYDPGFETALNERFVFLYKGKPTFLPKDVGKIQAAVFTTNETSKPTKEQADLVRSLLSKISGEPDMVSQILPKVVPLEQLQMNDQKEVAVDQYWRRCLALDPDLYPSLCTPKPDLTIGWNSEVFPFVRASKSLRAFQCPVASTNNISWPLFTAEVKGEGGSLRVAKLQNLHNAAIMLSNLRELTRAAMKEAEFFDKIHVISLQLTMETIQLSYYWATRSEDGQVSYYGNVLATWTPNSHCDEEFIEACCGIHSAIELVTNRAYPFVYSNMADIEKIYAAKSMAQIPSPRSRPSQRVRKTTSGKASTARAGSSKKSLLSRTTNSSSQNDDA